MGMIYWGNEHIPVPPPSVGVAHEVKRQIEEEAKVELEKESGASDRPNGDSSSQDTTKESSIPLRWRKALIERNGPEWVERHKGLLADSEEYIESL